MEKKEEKIEELITLEWLNEQVEERERIEYEKYIQDRKKFK